VATPVDLLSDVAVAFEALTGATRLASDLRDDLEPIPSGATRYQLRASSSGSASDSNVTRTLVSLELLLHHRLAGAERAWTEGSLQSHLETITRAAWWRALASVYGVDPDVEIELSREGAVVTASFSITVEIKP